MFSNRLVQFRPTWSSSKARYERGGPYSRWHAQVLSPTSLATCSCCFGRGFLSASLPARWDRWAVVLTQEWVLISREGKTPTCLCNLVRWHTSAGPCAA